MIGKTLRNFRITDKLGVGGQGAVYKATDTKLDRTVVIKVIPPELSAKEANLKRFEREAKLASSLDHPNICTIYDLDEVDGVHFIAMQFVEGKNVRQLGLMELPHQLIQLPRLYRDTRQHATFQDQADQQHPEPFPERHDSSIRAGERGQNALRVSCGYAKGGGGRETTSAISARVCSLT